MRVSDDDASLGQLYSVHLIDVAECISISCYALAFRKEKQKNNIWNNIHAEEENRAYIFD